MTARELLRWIVAPLALGVALGTAVDRTALPFSGNERVSAVFLIDGQGYFGHLEDLPWSDTIVIRDIYYFEDARKMNTNLDVALVKRGGEVHQPADAMRVRRDKILAVERITPTSPVARAIAVQRSIERPR